MLVGPQGIQGRYVKTRLVPFGEYIPFRQQLGWLTKISKAASSNMIPGTGAHTLTVTAPPERAAARRRRAGLLRVRLPRHVPGGDGPGRAAASSTSRPPRRSRAPGARTSRAASRRMRAAETGRPVVQAALTGDTVAFDARGRRLAWLGQDSHGVVTVSLEPAPRRPRRPSMTRQATT